VGRIQAICGTFEEFQRNPLLKLEDTDPASVFYTALHKLQHKISRAANTQMSRDLIEMMHLPIRGADPACSFGATNDLNVVRLQAIANLEKSTSGWLYANPAFFPSRINDSEFQIAFGCRNLLHLIDIGKACPGCNRKVLDRFGQHLFRCDKSISAPLRN
jgi:hypothetical protein